MPGKASAYIHEMSAEKTRNTQGYTRNVPDFVNVRTRIRPNTGVASRQGTEHLPSPEGTRPDERLT